MVKNDFLISCYCGLWWGIGSDVHRTLSHWLTQVIIEIRCFGDLCLVSKESPPECHHCVCRTMEAVLHSLAECPVFLKQRRGLVSAIRMEILSLVNMIAVMIWSENAWNSAIYFWQVMSWVAEQDRERFGTFPVHQYRRQLTRWR